jgi:hypothetical protein
LTGKRDAGEMVFKFSYERAQIVKRRDVCQRLFRKDLLERNTTYDASASRTSVSRTASECSALQGREMFKTQVGGELKGYPLPPSRREVNNEREERP